MSQTGLAGDRALALALALDDLHSIVVVDSVVVVEDAQRSMAQTALLFLLLLLDLDLAIGVDAFLAVHL